MSIEHTGIKVKVVLLASITVQITMGLRQGALSPILFNITLQKVKRIIDTDQEDVRFGEAKVGLLAYVDDIVLLAESPEELKRQSKKLIEKL